MTYREARCLWVVCQREVEAIIRWINECREPISTKIAKFPNAFAIPMDRKLTQESAVSFLVFHNQRLVKELPFFGPDREPRFTAEQIFGNQHLAFARRTQ
jgi:hypothetical protein